jgi:hypothetical protein
LGRAANLAEAHRTALRQFFRHQKRPFVRHLADRVIDEPLDARIDFGRRVGRQTEVALRDGDSREAGFSPGIML